MEMMQMVSGSSFMHVNAVLPCLKQIAFAKFVSGIALMETIDFSNFVNRLSWI